MNLSSLTIKELLEYNDIPEFSVSNNYNGYMISENIKRLQSFIKNINIEKNPLLEIDGDMTLAEFYNINRYSIGNVLWMKDTDCGHEWLVEMRMIEDMNRKLLFSTYDDKSINSYICPFCNINGVSYYNGTYAAKYASNGLRYYCFFPVETKNTISTITTTKTALLMIRQFSRPFTTASTAANNNQ